MMGSGGKAFVHIQAIVYAGSVVQVASWVWNFAATKRSTVKYLTGPTLRLVTTPLNQKRQEITCNNVGVARFNTMSQSHDRFHSQFRCVKSMSNCDTSERMLVTLKFSKTPNALNIEHKDPFPIQDVFKHRDTNDLNYDSDGHLSHSL